MGQQANQVQHECNRNIYFILGTISTPASRWPEAARKGKLHPFVQAVSRVTGCKRITRPVATVLGAVKEIQ